MEVTYSYRSTDGRINTVLSESFESHSDTFTYGYVYRSGGQYSPDSVSGPKKYSRTIYQANTERKGRDMTEENPLIEDPTKSGRRMKNALGEFEGLGTADALEMLDNED